MATVWLNKEEGLSLRNGVIYVIDTEQTIIKELTQEELSAMKHALFSNASGVPPYVVEDENKDEVKEFIEFYYDV